MKYDNDRAGQEVVQILDNVCLNSINLITIESF